MANDVARSVLVLGYGNPSRQDDGLGPCAVERLAKIGLSGVTTETAYQLGIEHSAEAEKHEVLIFVDAASTGVDSFERCRVAPSANASFTTHAVSPEQVLAVTRDLYGKTPVSWKIKIRGYQFGIAEGLTPEAETNLIAAVDALRALVAEEGRPR